MGNKKLKILLVGPMPPSIGGIATYLSNILNSDLITKFDLIPFSTSRPPNYNIPKYDSGHCCNYPPLFLLKSILITVCHIFMFPIVLIIKKPNIVHIHTASYLSFLENSIYVLISKIFRKKVLLHIHGGLFLVFFKNSSFLMKHFITYILSISDQVISLSLWWKSNIINEIGISKNKVAVIINGYNQSLFYPMNMEKCRKFLNLPLDQKIILTVGDLSSTKGHKYLIEAVSGVLKQTKDILCIIVGEGNLKNKLEEQVNLAGLCSYVKFVGNESHDKIPFWMNSCDVFVLPSLNESFGLVQIEAMACGKPVVATFNGGSEEIIISNDYGYLVKTKDSLELAEKIHLSIETSWNSKKIRKYAENFAWGIVTEKLLDIYSAYNPKNTKDVHE